MADFFGVDQGTVDLVTNAVADLTGNNLTKISRTKIVGDIFALGNDDKKFYFLDAEVPESFPEGGEQVHALHQFPGASGSRTIDTFGHQPVDIEFSGEIYSVSARQILVNAGQPGAGQSQKVQIKAQTAKQRSDVLKAFYTTGARVGLRFGSSDYIGVVTSYKANIHHENFVTYTIQYTVLKDNSKKVDDRKRNQALNVPPHMNLIQMISEYADKANKVIGLINSVVSVTKQIQTQLKQDPTKVYQTGVAMIPGVSAVTSVITSLHTLSDNLNDVKDNKHPQFMLDMQNAKPYQTLSTDSINNVMIPEMKILKASLTDATTGLTTTLPHLRIDGQRPWPDLTAAGAFYLRQMSALLELMMREFAKLVTPEHTLAVIYQNPNLITLATRYYGDPTKWTLIAQQNGLNTPHPIGTYSLIIPRDLQNTGSIPALTDSVGNG